MIIVGSEKKPPTPKEISMLSVFEKIGTQGWILNALRKLDDSLYVLNRISIEGMRTVRLSMKQSEQPLPVYGKTSSQTSKMIPSLNDQMYIPQIYLSGDMKPKHQGTLMHQALQQMRITPFSTEKLVRLNIGLTEKMINHLIAYSNLSFTKSLYLLKVSHEVPFMAKLDEQLVYGYIDMIAESDDTLIIVDFKTDRNVTQAQLIERHKHQIKTYIQAMALCTQKKIEAYIYSFDLNEYIKV
jgi:ATP-dependent helicase/nuclease subunit A